MEYAADIESTIEHYRRMLSLFMKPETRQTLERLLAKAEAEQALLRSAEREGPSATS